MILLLILLLSFCSAQSCAQSCPLKDAPVFSSDENLSFEDCGRRVDLPYDHYPWKAEIYSERYYCPGILISKKVVITFDEESDGFVEPTEQIRIYLGRCAEVDKEQPCTENNEGFRTTVERKVKLDIQSFDYFMYFFIIPKIPEFSDWVRPICLFNRDNSLDFSESQVYRAYSGYSVHNYTARIVQYSECFKENVENEFCDTENTMLCVFKDGSYWTRGLVNIHGGRFYLRGVFSNITHRDSYCTFVDILNHMDTMTSNAPDLFMLQKEVPDEPLPKLWDDESLSNPDCGTKSEKFRRELEHLEDIPVQHIIHGQATQQGRHPWHADISTPPSTRCGGTLITPRAVLTAAHCLPAANDKGGFNEMVVTMGMCDSGDTQELGRQKQNPSKFIIHPNFSPSTYANDIGLLLFDADFNITDFVRPICLWSEDSNFTLIENKLGTVAGWGLDETLEQPDVLQSVRLPLIPHKECYFSKSSFYGRLLYPGLNFCAGYMNGTSTCNGDSGGGLVLKWGDRWFLRGIVSAGRGHKTLKFPDGKRVCEPNAYTLFTDVAHYVSWIVSKLPDLK